MEINIPKKYKNDIKTIHAAKIGKRTTIVVLELFSGFEIYGTSQIKDSEKYDKELGLEYALEESYSKLEGFKIYYHQEVDKEIKEFMNLPNEPLKKDKSEFNFSLSPEDFDINKTIEALNKLLKDFGGKEDDRNK